MLLEHQRSDINCNQCFRYGVVSVSHKQTGLSTILDIAVAQNFSKIECNLELIFRRIFSNFMKSDYFLAIFNNYQKMATLKKSSTK
jgi:hypothetical protein